jgi:hypothetical protein
MFSSSSSQQRRGYLVRVGNEFLIEDDEDLREDPDLQEFLEHHKVCVCVCVCVCVS